MVTEALRNVAVPDEDTSARAAQAFRTLADFLRAHPTPTPQLRLVAQDSEPAEVVVPSIVLEVLIDLLDNLARGNAVTIAPIHAELTTQQAAELLNVSRPYLVSLLEQGDIPFRKVGNRRRVRLEDVLTFQRGEEARRREVMRELTQEAEDLGLYDTADG